MSLQDMKEKSAQILIYPRFPRARYLCQINNSSLLTNNDNAHDRDDLHAHDHDAAPFYAESHALYA